MLVSGLLLAFFVEQKLDVDQSTAALTPAYFDLVVHPEKYDGKKISINGYVHLNKETRNTVFFAYDKTAMDIYRASEIFYVMRDQPDERLKLFEKLHGKYIQLVAVYRHRCSEAPFKEKENIISHTGIAGCFEEVSAARDLYYKSTNIRNGAEKTMELYGSSTVVKQYSPK